MEKFILMLIVFLVISFEEANADQCEEILVPLCRGLIGYTHTKLPNRYGHTSQSQVYRAIEGLWQYIDSGCSENLRLTTCGLYLPNCTESSNEVELPCRETCFRARRHCKKKFKKNNVRYPSRKLRCRGLRRERQGGCIASVRSRRNPVSEAGICQPNMLSMCQNLPFELGTLPNFFNQSNVNQIEIEMSFYQPLIDSNCHPDFRFFLCGTYRPFCVHSYPWALPCRELCEDIKQQCQSEYETLFGNLPWPQKFQCHLFQSSTSSTGYPVCVVPSDGVQSVDSS